MARPLTKKDQNGNLYTRPPTVETAIDEAIQQDLATFAQRAGVTNRSSPDFLPLECLVYLIRDARRRGDQETMNALMPPFLGRCEAILKAKIPDTMLTNAEETRGNVLGELSVLFAEDGSSCSSGELDFFECRFHLAFRRFRIPFIDRERLRTEPLVSLSPMTDDELLSHISEAFRPRATQVDYVLRNALLRAIDALPPDERKAVVLCFFYELKEESDNPSVTTAATLCGVTGRTIRNRLRRAIATLSKQLKEKEDICL